MDVRIVRSVSELRKVEKDLRNLWGEDPKATVFQSYDWVSAWGRIYGSYANSLFCLFCYDGGRVVACAPLYQTKAHGITRQTSLMFIGTGEDEREESCAEYLAPIYLKGYRSKADHAFAKAVVNDSTAKSFSFQRVRYDLCENLAKEIAKQWGMTTTSRSIGWCYSMPTDREKALAQLSSKQRSTIRRKFSKLDKIPGIKFEVVEESNWRLSFQDLVRLHQSRWRALGCDGAFAAPRFCCFHDSLGRELLKRGELFFTRLVLNGDCVATAYCFLSKNICHYYQGGFDYNFYPEISLGSLMHFLTAESAAARGCLWYDYMLSTRPDYKERYAMPVESLANIETCRSSSSEQRVLGMLKRAIRKVY
jgi:CelD/BcsL family acetyltransferase involved in cellulose biosynthesis